MDAEGHMDNESARDAISYALEDLPAAVKTARKAQGMTQAQLATKVHLSRSTIAQLENGNIPDLGFRKLAVALQALGFELSIVPLKPPPTLHELYRLNAIEQDRALRETDALLKAIS